MIRYYSLLNLLLILGTSLALSTRPAAMNRRAALGLIGAAAPLVTSPLASLAAADCYSDCMKNCKLIAPKDSSYCTENCKAYCEQDDRTDGLSGSVSSEGGETGILGLNTVVKGEDKPPQIKIPGLDFSSDKGKKLIGY